MEGQPSWCQPHILLDCRVKGETAVLVPATHTLGLQDHFRDSRHGASHTYSWTAGSMEGQWSRCHPHILLDCGVNGGTADLVPATHTPGLHGQWRDSRPGTSHTYSWTAGSMEGQLSWCQPHILLDRVNGGTAVLVPATHTPGLQGQWRDSQPGASHTFSWTAGSMEGQPSWFHPYILLDCRVTDGQLSWCQTHILLDYRINGGTAVLEPATHTPGLQAQWRDSRPGASHTYSWTAGSMEGQPSWCQPHILLDRVNGGTAVLEPATHTPGLQDQWRDSRPGASHTYSWTGSMEGQPSWCQPHILLDCRINGGTAVLVPATHTPGQGQWRDSRPGASHTYSWTAGSMEGQLSWCQPHILLDRVNGGTAVLGPATHTPGLQDQWRDSCPGASHTYSWTGSMEGQPSWCQAHILLDCRVNGGTAVLVPATHTPGQVHWRDSSPGASHTYSWTAVSLEGQPSWCQPHILLDCRVNGGTAGLLPATHTPAQGQWRDSCPGATTHTPGMQDQWRDSCPGASHTYSWNVGSLEGQPSWCQPHILLHRVNGGTAVLVAATHTPGQQGQWRDSCPGASHTYSWTAGSKEGQLSWCQPHILLDRVNGGTAVLVPATHTPGLQGQWRDSRPGASHTAGSMAGQPSCCQPHILMDCRVNGGTAVLGPATHTPGLQGQCRDSCPGASHTYSWTAESMEGLPSSYQPHILLDCRVKGGTAVLVPSMHTPRLHGH
ncbi:hypothetical protein NDU88_007801 [Pleurodeles waltl]|uniref:Uncharacterized protein n=1 Tax=Pleurodeles waltl TaxID=8319 RepID=A0AAV7LYU5_PLEWA|nr:hypothetical protein NDU88_007801 [Pleurodeles waltl]